MATFPNIPYRVLLVLVLTIFLSPPLFTHQAQNLVAADDQLIISECHNSDTPETCIRCVKSDPGAGKADKIGIAAIVINCISSQANALATNLTRLASHEKDRKLVNIYKTCADAYSRDIGKKALPQAKQALKNHQYDKAETAVAQALGQDADCYNIMKSQYGEEVPVEIFFSMLVYEELSEAACRIIERF